MLLGVKKRSGCRTRVRTYRPHILLLYRSRSCRLTCCCQMTCTLTSSCQPLGRTCPAAKCLAPSQSSRLPAKARQSFCSERLEQVLLECLWMYNIGRISMKIRCSMPPPHREDTVERILLGVVSVLARAMAILASSSSEQETKWM